MQYNIKISSYSIQWTYFLLLLFSFIFSCKNHENKKQEVETLPTGKWRIIQLKNPQVYIVFDTTSTYFLEHNAKNRIIITAEDNSLSSNLIVVHKNSFKMGNVAVSDVCCNSEEAQLLFRFFYDTLKYEQLGNKLILSSNKTVVTLENIKQE